MAKSKQLGDYSIPELRQQEKTLKAIIAFVIGLGAVFIAYLAFVLLTGGWTRTHSTSIAALAALGGATVPTMARAGAIRKEIASRETAASVVAG